MSEGLIEVVVWVNKCAPPCGPSKRIKIAPTNPDFLRVLICVQVGRTDTFRTQRGDDVDRVGRHLISILSSKLVIKTDCDTRSKVVRPDSALFFFFLLLFRGAHDEKLSGDGSRRPPQRFERRRENIRSIHGLFLCCSSATRKRERRGFHFVECRLKGELYNTFSLFFWVSRRFRRRTRSLSSSLLLLLHSYNQRVSFELVQSIHMAFHSFSMNKSPRGCFLTTQSNGH